MCEGWGGRWVRTATFSVRSRGHASVWMLTSLAPQVDVTFASMRGTESSSAFSNGVGEWQDLSIDGYTLATVVGTACILDGER